MALFPITFNLNGEFGWCYLQLGSSRCSGFLWVKWLAWHLPLYCNDSRSWFLGPLNLMLNWVKYRPSICEGRRLSCQLARWYSVHYCTDVASSKFITCWMVSQPNLVQIWIWKKFWLPETTGNTFVRFSLPNQPWDILCVVCLLVLWISPNLVYGL